MCAGLRSTVIRIIPAAHRTKARWHVSLARLSGIVRRETGAADPYRQAKDDSTRQALALYPRLKSLVAEADDPLETAVRLSIAGNIIEIIHIPVDYHDVVRLTDYLKLYDPYRQRGKILQSYLAIVVK